MKALVVVGGISSNAYIKQAVKQSNMDLTQYERICQVDYDQFLDKRFRLIPFYSKLKILDVHGDWWQFALNKTIREEIRNKISKTLRHFGPTCDLLAHSLGTWASLGSLAKVNNAYMFGSPIGSPSKVVRNIVEKELLEIEDGLMADVLTYCYNYSDKVSCDDPNAEVLNKFCRKLKIFNTGDGHGILEYINSYLEEIDYD